MNEHADVSPRRMRQIMGSFCSGITIITAATDAGPAGFTCQSFTSLSLDPPLVTFNPSRTSTSWPRIQEAGSFCVNILGIEQEHVSRTFAQTGVDRFAGVEHSPSDRGNPILDAALAWIDCTLHAEYEGGDHTIVVGEVKGMHAREEVDPLVFFRGGYATLHSSDAMAG
ncbi:flavin reductase family protein [Brevibacterium jeotgali]|uniref:NADH-FMN oxidoreductase RutF, flavin reductase (DIM6/NTAB) family n=1 Tax=Brevibacterium jeotgali TaxID=1262550 RepID=A0A2H1L4P5_9MICO|nr:flavin reductase family protein [Brevibacterium jeotgali]TWC01528.1 flavin reductase (DIM6/NTAB) family NADH-FMN oxidoreductase RutF [Brevibacterium jeotgali]SMY11866.1 NADH-FMN oxidoreductase RutF, flavin reductase (DIM6/NTAB) family [Brevibacterium jeotgali]